VIYLKSRKRRGWLISARNDPQVAPSRAPCATVSTGTLRHRTPAHRGRRANQHLIAIDSCATGRVTTRAPAAGSDAAPALNGAVAGASARPPSIQVTSSCCGASSKKLVQASHRWELSWRSRITTAYRRIPMLRSREQQRNRSGSIETTLAETARLMSVIASPFARMSTQTGPIS